MQNCCHNLSYNADKIDIHSTIHQAASTIAFIKKNKNKNKKKHGVNKCIASGVARAFPGRRLAHPEGQNEEENK